MIMKVEQLYTGCLAEAAYYIESEGEVAIIDPLRETEPYLQKAKRNKADIKYIFETHFHADFVSGHIDLARKSGGIIVFGPNAQPSYDAYIAQDGETFKVGKLTIKTLHTPGHTMESTTYLLLDEEGKEHCIFTGDMLFIGDVGRPDLAVKSDLTQEDLAGHLFDSLRNKIMTLPDEVIVYPAHGAGSACGKNMSSETFDTLGHQKKANYALNTSLSKEEFIKEVTDGLEMPPQYFPKNVALNKLGYDNIDEVMAKGLRALTAEQFANEMKQGNTLVLDTRPVDVFPKGFIEGAMFVGIDDNFAPWVGKLVENLQQRILIVADNGREEEVVRRLARVGYDNAIGYLKGGFEAWQNAGKPIDSFGEMNAEELPKIYQQDPSKIIDVRRPSEYNATHLEGAQNKPLDFIYDEMPFLNKEESYYIHCAGGYRSIIFSSILKRNGFASVFNIKGGYKEIVKVDLPRKEYQAADMV